MNRVIIGALLVALVLLANWGGQLGVSLMVLLFSLAALREAFNILEKQGIQVPRTLILIFVCLFNVLALIIPDLYEKYFFVILLSHLTVFLLFTLCFYLLKLINTQFPQIVLNVSKDYEHFISSILLLVYLGLAPSFYPLIRGLEHGDLFLLTIIFSVALNDIFALVGGKNFGLIPLSKTISPNKKIEGSLFGLLMGSLCFALCILLCKHQLDPRIISAIGSFMKGYLGIIHFKEAFLNWALVFILGLILAIIAQMGDLFESMIKRRAKVKDSGTLLQAQGGILDRIDSHYFVIGFAYLVFYFFIR
jgi:phosphatidate cytidylyltransferase